MQVFSIATGDFGVTQREGAMLKQERDLGLPTHGNHVRLIAFMKLCLSQRDRYFGMRNRREKRIHIFGEEILRVLFAGQGGYHAMFPELRVFANPLFFDIQNWSGDALSIDPPFEIETGRKE